MVMGLEYLCLFQDVGIAARDASTKRHGVLLTAKNLQMIR